MNIIIVIYTYHIVLSYVFIYVICVSVIKEGHSLRDIDCSYIPEHLTAVQTGPWRPHRKLKRVQGPCEEQTPSCLVVVVAAAL